MFHEGLGPRGRHRPPPRAADHHALAVLSRALYAPDARLDARAGGAWTTSTTARAKGVTERRIMFVHVLRNALLPVVTMAGVQVGALIGGSVIVESVFAWPGLGMLAFEALFARDLNLLLGIFLHLGTAGGRGQPDRRHHLLPARPADRGRLRMRRVLETVPAQPLGRPRARRSWRSSSPMAAFATCSFPGDPFRLAGRPCRARARERVPARQRLARARRGRRDRARRQDLAADRPGRNASRSVCIGAIMGALAGYYGGWVDDIADAHSPRCSRRSRRSCSRSCWLRS